jgi:hypothetical protein
MFRNNSFPNPFLCLANKDVFGPLQKKKKTASDLENILYIKVRLHWLNLYSVKPV